MNTDADITSSAYLEAVEALEIIGELLTHPHPDWARIAALTERSSGSRPNSATNSAPRGAL
jgi:hypothetical protein